MIRVRLRSSPSPALTLAAQDKSDGEVPLQPSVGPELEPAIPPLDRVPRSTPDVPQELDVLQKSIPQPEPHEDKHEHEVPLQPPVGPELEPAIPPLDPLQPRHRDEPAKAPLPPMRNQ